MKNLTTVSDLSPEQAEEIVASALSFKRKHDEGIHRENVLNGKVVALIFEKPSLRTKVAFEVAAHYLGGTAVFLSSGQIFASGNEERGRESIPDIGRNLERFAELLVVRTYSHSVIKELAAVVTKPVINALCDSHHPTQALADLMTIRMLKNDVEKPLVAFVGDGNNVATSLLQICALVGIDVRIASPDGFTLPESECNVARELAQSSGSELTFSNNPVKAIEGADVVYTDTFVSMGQEEEKATRIKMFEGFRVTADLLSHAKQDAIFMHCLPAHRGEEVTDEVMDCGQSVVFDQAECRLHIAKALLARMIG